MKLKIRLHKTEGPPLIALSMYDNETMDLCETICGSVITRSIFSTLIPDDLIRYVYGQNRFIVLSYGVSFGWYCGVERFELTSEKGLTRVSYGNAF